MALGFQSEEGTASSWRRVGRPRCASAQGARDTPPHGRGPLSLLSRPTSCLFLPVFCCYGEMHIM